VTSPLPHHVAVVATRIARFATLNRDDQLRAAALALQRDYGVQNASLHVAARALASDGVTDRVLIAYTTSNSADASIDFAWANVAASGTIFWITRSDVPHEGSVLSDQGVAHIDAWRDGDEVPAALVALLGARAREKRAARVVLVERNDHRVPDAALALWSASLGVPFERGTLPQTREAMRLQSVPIAAVSAPSTKLDRALVAALCAACACVALAAWRWSATPSAAVASNATPIPAGELWARATTTAPQLIEHGRSANFGGGAWVIAAPALPLDELPRVESALSANGLAAQIVRQPEVRVRVQRP
jgi:HAMP domain-containing protein